MPEKDEFKGAGLLNLFLLTAFFVSPLLFFTDLTRNPYYLQITLLNISLLAALAIIALNALRGCGGLLEKSPLNAPAAVLLALYLCSFLYAYFNHSAFFRPSMASEGLRVALYTIVNCFFVFHLSLKTPFAGGEKPEGPATGKWLALVLCWGALWFVFPFAKTPAAGQDFWSRFWDPYGGFLWVGGAAAVYLALRKPARQEDVLAMIMSAAGISALYGVLEYFHIELVWAKLINPYGNRSVSTFGNPNFISSYVVMLLPLTACYLIGARTLGKRVFYGLLFFSYEGMLMSSQTRSSWMGAVAALAFVFLFSPVRRKFGENKDFLQPMSAAALILLLLWPNQALKPSGSFLYLCSGLFFLSSFPALRRKAAARKKILLPALAAALLLAVLRPSSSGSGAWHSSSALFERVTEATSRINSSSSFSLAVATEKVYQSFHQRLLIWSSAWQMGLENPLLGKGWGLFELFYPFYQGNLIFNYPAARNLRTHANNSHNEILEQWSQAGLLGLGAYLWFFFTLGAGFYSYVRRSAPEAAASAVPLAAALAGMFADNMFNVSLHFAVPGLLFWWLAGALALKVFSPAPSEPSSLPVHTSSGPLRRAGLVSVVCFCALAAIFWQRQFMREFHYFNGFKEMRRGNFVQAALELKTAHDYHPREVNNNYELANAFTRSGELKEARWAYGEALKANAGYDEIYFNLAVVERSLADLPGALNALKTSLFINPLNPQVYQALAGIYMDPAAGRAVKDPAREAAGLFSEGVSIFPADGNMWNTLGYFHTMANDLRGAKEAYGRGVRADPENKMLADNLLAAAAKLKLKPDPDLEWLSLYNSASSGLSGGDIGKALKDAGILLGLDPGSPKLAALKARLLFRAGDLRGAKNLLLPLLERNPADNSLRYGLAVLYEKEGDFAGARAAWGEFLKYEPGNTAVAARLRALP